MTEFRENEDTFRIKAEKLWSLLLNSKNIAIFTGAGISTLSGIPDFRGKYGINKEGYQGYSIEDVLDIDFFKQRPEVFYDFAKNSWYRFDEYEPSIVHKVLRKMEEKHLLKEGIFTQNIDFLHERANSKKVYNLHGTVFTSSCMGCGKKYSFEETKKLINIKSVPKCLKCNSLIRPDIVFYGENLDMDLLDKAQEVFSKADLALILGSSLTVYPAASLPKLTKYYGGKTVIVNAQATAQDNDAQLIFRDLEQVFTFINKALDTL